MKLVKILGDIYFPDEIKKAIYIIDSTFSGGVDFTAAFFSGKVVFEAVKFLGITNFEKAIFIKETNFLVSEFLGLVTIFKNSNFYERATFNHVEFSKAVNFQNAVFTNGVDFFMAKFSGDAFFEFATFTGDTNFLKAKFLENAEFLGTRFAGRINFSACQFKGPANFYGCLYPPKYIQLYRLSSSSREVLVKGNIPPEIVVDFYLTPQNNFDIRKKNGDWEILIIDKDKKWKLIIREESDRLVVYKEETKIIFDGVTGFSNLLFEWEDDASFDNVIFNYARFVSNIYETQRRGLKERFEYNETFYSALIKNFHEMGLTGQANDAYYRYRVDKRKIKLNYWNKGLEILFLDITFGYGVKPQKLFRSFIVTWIFFSLFYFFCQSLEKKWSWWWRCFVWSITYSFDNLTPGINLGSRTITLQNWGGYNFKKDSRIVFFAESLQKILGWYLLALFLILFGKIWIY